MPPGTNQTRARGPSPAVVAGTSARSGRRLTCSVDEDLVRRYFELRGYFVRRHPGFGLCVLDARSGDAAVVELEEAQPPRRTARDGSLAAVSVVLGRADVRRVRVVARPDSGRVTAGPGSSGGGVEILEFPQVLRYLSERDREAAPPNVG